MQKMTSQLHHSDINFISIHIKRSPFRYKPYVYMYQHKNNVTQKLKKMNPSDGSMLAVVIVVVSSFYWIGPQVIVFLSSVDISRRGSK